ncbi:WSC domain-containing protein 1 [Penaeus vannamei]|uniref:WSC domain-containing protein 1 n=1 Tax=Penaeus vannamei TaxID=6689 RepID=A0A3R7PRE3_PENVA|nr:WSC domain-containing protein 1 [Penaeus vannamei]
MARLRPLKHFVLLVIFFWAVKILHSKKDNLTPFNQRLQEVVLEGRRPWEVEDYLAEEDVDDGVVEDEKVKEYEEGRGEGYLGERHKYGWGTTIATKSHFIKHLQKYRNVPTVTIIRNPARVFVSLWSYVNLQNRRRKHVESVAESSLRTQEFHDFVQSKLKKWLNTTLFSLTQCRDVFPVFYESVREDPVGETRRILEYLKVKPQEDRLACLGRHVGGNVKGAQKSLDPYTQEEKELFLQALKKVNETLTQRGFPTLPDYSKYKS